MKTAELKNSRVTIKEPTNGAENIISTSMPYTVEVTIEGTADMLLHRWNCEAVDEKAKARKGSAAKKTDDIESYVYRCENGNIGIPSEYLRMSLINAAKYKQDPRSPRKSAMDIYKAAIVGLTNLSDTGLKTWDYLDKRRVVIQKNGINRTRPALKAGWKLTFELMCNLPEYIDPNDLYEVIASAGRLIGLGDFRPTFGRFQIINWKIK